MESCAARGAGLARVRIFPMRKLYPWLGLLALAGCKQAPDLPSAISPYKIEIQQGNVVTQEMLAKLKAGMTRAQVRFALGSPLVVDAFHTDRWDYIFSLEKQGKSVERRRVTVIFDEDKLLRLEGDILPVDSSLISDRVPPPRPPVVTAPAPVPAEKPAAPKPEVAKPVAKPVVKAPVVAKPAAKPPAAAAEAAKAEAAKVDAAKAEAARVDAAKAEAARVEAAKDEAARAAAARAEAEKYDAARAEAAKAEAAKAEAAKAEAAKAEAAKAEAAKAEAAKADTKPAPAEAKKPEIAKTDAGKEKPKQGGFFGRMLDKIGF